MSTKTFNSESRRSMSMEIHQCDGTIPDEYIVQFMDGDHVLKSFYYKKSDAPAQALAILEAAGGRDSLGIDVGNAMTDLREYVTEQERVTAEAKEQAELEAEGYALYFAWVESTGSSAIADSLNDMHRLAKDQWLAVARRAREMRAA